MEFKSKNINLLRKIFFINYPLKPKIKNFFYDGEEGKIEFDIDKNFSGEIQELIRAGYANFGLYFSKNATYFPDILDEPKKLKISGKEDFSFFMWEEIFPKEWEEILKDQLFIFLPDKNLKGNTAFANYFRFESILKGKNVLYFDLSSSKNPYDDFLKLKDKKNFDVYIFDHVGSASNYDFEKFLIFILKAPVYGCEIVATQWPSKYLPEGKFLEFPTFPFAKLLKIFYFPELTEEKYLKLMEDSVSKYGYLPQNLVINFLKKLKLYEDKKVKIFKDSPFEVEKVKEDLKKGKVFSVLPYYEKIKNFKDLYIYLLGYQGEFDNLFSILEKPEKDLIPLIFICGYENLIEEKYLKKYLPEEILKFLKKDLKIEKIEDLNFKDEKILTFLKLIISEKFLREGKVKESKKIIEDLKEKKDFEPFEMAQTYRFLGYFYFYNGEMEKALNCFLKWIEISEENGWFWQIPLGYNDLAVLYIENKKFEKAEKALRCALNFSIFLKEEKKKNLLLFNLAVSMIDCGNFEKAKEIFKDLEKIHREKGDFYSLIFDLYEYSRILYYQGEIEECKEKLIEIEEILNNFKDHPRKYYFLILKTELSKWISIEEYEKNLGFLKKIKDFPEHLRFERDEVLREKFLEPEDLNLDSIKNAIKILQLKLLFGKNVNEKILKETFDYLEKKGASGWVLRFKKLKEKPSPVFLNFGKRDFDLGEIPFDFKIILENGEIIEKGEVKNPKEIIYEDGTKIIIPNYLNFDYSKEIFYAWAITIAYKFKKKEKEISFFQEELENFNGFYYMSPIMKKTVEDLKKISKKDVPVHIYGETGTGKEILARAIHKESKRANGPFVAVNCSAIPENLFESEFFGFKKGAFTGALMDRTGFFEEANNGTLFLDEIGDMPLPLQAKLLRVLQEKEIRRLGDTKTKKVDFRLITATNKNLKKLVEEGKFREDLYYRIVISEVFLPPLRERKEEIIPMAKFFISKNLKILGIKNIKIDPIFFKSLEENEWKGNLRELENFLISKLANLQDGDTLKISDQLKEVSIEKKEIGNYHHLINNYKKQIIEEALKIANGSRVKAAQILGITPQALGYIIKELKMVKYNK